MAAVSLAAHPDSFDYEKRNLTKNCDVFNASSSISCVRLAFIHHVFHVTPHVKIHQTEIQRPRWPILRIVTADTSVRSLSMDITEYTPDLESVVEIVADVPQR